MTNVKELIVAITVVVISCLGGYAIATANATTVTHTCVQFPNHDSYLCAAGLTGDGAIYWDDNLAARTFDWHPTTGLQRTDETFFCAVNDSNTADGHTSCAAAAPGTYSGEQEWQRRTITLADGCRVISWDVLDTVTNPPAPQWCSLPDGGIRPMTSNEQQSVLSFWRILQIIPGAW